MSADDLTTQWARASAAMIFIMLNQIISVPGCYGLNTAMQWLMKNINNTFNSQKTPHMMPSWTRYEVSIGVILEKIFCIIYIYNSTVLYMWEEEAPDSDKTINWPAQSSLSPTGRLLVPYCPSSPVLSCDLEENLMLLTQAPWKIN